MPIFIALSKKIYDAEQNGCGKEYQYTNKEIIRLQSLHNLLMFLNSGNLHICAVRCDEQKDQTVLDK